MNLLNFGLRLLTHTHRKSTGFRDGYLKLLCLKFIKIIHIKFSPYRTGIIVHIHYENQHCEDKMYSFQMSRQGVHITTTELCKWLSNPNEDGTLFRHDNSYLRNYNESHHTIQHAVT